MTERIRYGVGALLACAMVMPTRTMATEVITIVPDQRLDMYLHKVPPEAPASQRLAYAGRLYKAGRLDEAKAVAEHLLPNHGVAPEALLLLARIDFTAGGTTGIEASRDTFEKLVLRYPDSAPIRDGRVVKKIEQAIRWLIGDQDWGASGAWLSLLKRIDPAAVGAIAKTLEAQLGRALTAFYAAYGMQTRAIAKPFRNWLQDNRRGECDYIGSCLDSDQECGSVVENRADRRAETKNTDEQRQWEKQADEKFNEQKVRFVEDLLENAQSYPLLAELVTDQVVAVAIRPAQFPEQASPFEYRVVSTYRTTSSWLRGRRDERNWRVCRRLSQSRADLLDLPALHLAKLNKNDLLKRLGALLYSGQQNENRYRHRL